MTNGILNGRKEGHTMPSVKIAITLPQEVFDKTEHRAHEQGVPRSQIIAKALEEQYRREEARRLLDEINRTYADGLRDEEKAALEAGRRLFAETLEPEEW
jgi:metal-responsive CopG/Arc/MetJ family transcriptional regulator